MPQVIETNISIDSNGIYRDFQSRVINVDSWESYVEEIKNAKCVIRNGTMNGNSIPRCSVVSDLQYDDFHLSCDVYNYQGIKTRKLCYLSSVPIKF